MTKYFNESEYTYRIPHINQVRGYIEDSNFNEKKIGALMYPTLNIDLEKGRVIPIEGSHIIVKTINLDTYWENIEKDLLSFEMNPK